MGRTLRSGKPLPDIPGVKRGSLGGLGRGEGPAQGAGNENEQSEEPPVKARRKTISVASNVEEEIGKEVSASAGTSGQVRRSLESPNPNPAAPDGAPAPVFARKSAPPPQVKEEEKEGEGTPAKRGRGRPRKYPRPEEVVATAKAEEVAATAKAEESAKDKDNREGPEVRVQKMVVPDAEGIFKCELCTTDEANYGFCSQIFVDTHLWIEHKIPQGMFAGMKKYSGPEKIAAKVKEAKSQEEGKEPKIENGGDGKEDLAASNEVASPSKGKLTKTQVSPEKTMDQEEEMKKSKNGDQEKEEEEQEQEQEVDTVEGVNVDENDTDFPNPNAAVDNMEDSADVDQDESFELDQEDNANVISAASVAEDPTKRFVCKFCGIRYSFVVNLSRHLRYAHDVPKAVPKGRGRKSRSHLTRSPQKPQEMQEDTRPFGCELCPVRYSYKVNLTKHMRDYHGIAKPSIPNTGQGQGKNMELEMSLLDQDMEVGENEQPSEEDLKACEQDEVTGDYDYDTGFRCDHCDKVFKNAKSLNTHKWYHAREKQFVCHICNRGFKYSTDLNRHVLTHSGNGVNSRMPAATATGSPGRTMVTRGITQKVTGSPAKQLNRNEESPPIKASLAHAAAAAVRQPIPAAATSGSNQNQAQGNAVRVNYRFPGYAANGRAVPGQPDTRPFGCRLCPQRFNHRSNLSRHVRLIHRGGQTLSTKQSVIKPPYQGKMQNPPTFARVGMATVSNGGRMNPGMIRPNFGHGQGQIHKVPNRTTGTTSQVLTPDMYTFVSGSVRPFVCNHCGKAFENKNNIWTHMRIHNKMFACEYCGLKMATRGDLVLHLRTHTGEKPYACTLCEWRFSRKSGLNKHMEKYHGTNPWKLGSGINMSGSEEPSEADGDSETGVTITQMDGSGSCMMLKTKYTCRFCNALIIGNNNYLKHMNDHLQTQKSDEEDEEESENDHLIISPYNNSTRYVCKECGEEFDSQEDLTGHVSTHASEDPRCKLCGKTCPSLTILNKHYRVVHPKARNPADEIQARLMQRQKEMRSRTGAKGTFSPLGVRTMKKGIDGEVSDEEFLHESDDPPNMNKIGMKVLDLNNLEDLDEDDIQYAPINPKNGANGIGISSFNNGAAPPPCNRCGKKFGSHRTRAEHIMYCMRAQALQAAKKAATALKPSPVPNKAWYEIDEDDIQYAPINPKNGAIGIGISPANTGSGIGPCERCGKQFTNKKARADHVWYCKRAKLFRCPVFACQKEFKLKHDFGRHLRRHNNENRHKCRICSASFPHRQDANRHMKEVHNFQTKCRAYPCDFCPENFLQENELEYHMKVDHGVSLADVFGNGEADLDEETEMQGDQGQEEEQGEDSTVVDVDPLALPGTEVETEGNEKEENPVTEEMDEEEMEMMLDPTSFLEQSMGEMDGGEAPEGIEGLDDDNLYCNICNKSFPTRQKWMYHRYYHSREEKYECSECDEKFKLRSHLERHVRTYHNEGKPVQNIMSCTMCPRKFTREYDLTTHMHKVHYPPQQGGNPQLVVRHRTSLPPSATVTSFSQSQAQPQSGMGRPMPKLMAKPHLPSGIQSPLNATTAAKLVFGQRRSLPPVGQSSTSTPTSQAKATNRPTDFIAMPGGIFRCKLCGKVFHEKKSIDAHRYYHNREEKHICVNCGAKFKQKSDLQRHIRIHHNPLNPKKTINCPTCFRSFTDIRYLRMHMRRDHSGSGAVSTEEEGYSYDGQQEGEIPSDHKEQVEVLMGLPEEQEGFQLTITCEGCGDEIDGLRISEHQCSSSSSSPLEFCEVGREGGGGEAGFENGLIVREAGEDEILFITEDELGLRSKENGNENNETSPDLKEMETEDIEDVSQPEIETEERNDKDEDDAEPTTEKEETAVAQDEGNSEEISKEEEVDEANPNEMETEENPQEPSDIL